jgi:hypothetical protein
MQSKGVNVSQSRQGSARSAAILLYSYHLQQLNAINDELKNRYQSSSHAHDHQQLPPPSASQHYQNFYCNEFMIKYIEQQLEDQKRLLYYEIPALRNHSKLMKKLRLNLKSESDLMHLDSYDSVQHLIGNSPLQRNKKQRKLVKHPTAIDNVLQSHKADKVDERSDDLFPNKSADNVVDLNDSSDSQIHNVSLNTNQSTSKLGGGYENPLAYRSMEGLDDSECDSSSDEDFYHRMCYRDVVLCTLPSPASTDSPPIAVNIDVYAYYVYMYI